MDIKLSIARMLYYKLADEFGGGEAPPGSTLKVRFGGHNGEPLYSATTHGNDGHDIWIANEKGNWIIFFSQKAARKLAWFILWDWWAKGTWFGLKRMLWYWALDKKVEETKRYNKSNFQVGKSGE